MPKVQGVYVISDETAGKAYVGSSVDLSKRIREHELTLQKGKHPNWKLRRAFAQGNRLVVLPIPMYAGEDPIAVEQALLNKFYDDGVLYNLARDAVAPNKGISPSEATREKMRQANKGFQHTEETMAVLRERAQGRCPTPECREASAAVRRGVPLSPEHRQKVGAAAKAAMTPEAREHLRQVNVGIPHTAEDIERMKQIKRERSGQPVCIEGRTYGSIAEAGEALGMKHATVKARTDNPNFPQWQRLQ